FVFHDLADPQTHTLSLPDALPLSHAVLDRCLAGSRATGGRAEPLVHRTVAVVVDAVADLRRGRTRRAGLRHPAHAVLDRCMTCTSAADTREDHSVHQTVARVVLAD